MKKKISALLLLFVSSLSPIVQFSFLTKTNYSQATNYQSAKTTETQKWRQVKKFKSIRPKGYTHFLANKNKVASANIKINVLNIGSYDFRIKFTNHKNSIDDKKLNFTKNINKNSKDTQISVGATDLSTIQIQTPKNSKNWVGVEWSSVSSIDPTQISTSSVSYEIQASGSLINEHVKISLSYRLRNQNENKSNYKINLGNFDVYNQNKKIKGFAKSDLGQFLWAAVGVVITLLVIAAEVASVYVYNYFMNKRINRMIDELVTIERNLRTSVDNHSSICSDLVDEHNRLRENMIFTRSDGEKRIVAYRRQTKLAIKEKSVQFETKMKKEYGQINALAESNRNAEQLLFETKRQISVFRSNTTGSLDFEQLKIGANNVTTDTRQEVLDNLRTKAQTLSEKEEHMVASLSKQQKKIQNIARENKLMSESLTTLQKSVEAF